MSLSDIGAWDLILITVVSIQATVLAYLSQPSWKAILSTLPIPFTIATMAVGRPIGPSNVLGLVLFFAFFHEVRWLFSKRKWPIVSSIVVSTLTYCALGISLNQVVPDSDEVFWIVSGLAWLVFIFLLLKMPFRAEPGHKSPLPIYIKLPIVMGVVIFLVTIKNMLGGFATVFPMVSVVAAYEGRRSLWTLERQVPAQAIAMVPMMATIHIVQLQIGQGPALLMGWVVFLCAYVPLTWSIAFRRGGPGTPVKAHI